MATRRTYKREARRGPKPKEVVDHPESLFNSWTEPDSFGECLELQMRRHGDTCWHLHKAVIRPRERFDRATLRSWVSGRRIPRSSESLAILARIEHRYSLPAGHFRSHLPHPARATSRKLILGVSRAEARRIAWHLPDDFASRMRVIMPQMLGKVPDHRTPPLRGGGRRLPFPKIAIE
jgi:hypothetical protein